MSFEFKSAFRASVSGVCIALSLAWLFAPQIASAQQVRLNEVDAWVGESGAVVLLPGSSVPLQGRIPISAKWAAEQELLIVEAKPRPTGKDRMALTLKDPQDIERELFVWKPGSNSAVRLMTLTGYESMMDVVQVPNTDWYIIAKDSYSGDYVVTNPRLSSPRPLQRSEDSSIVLLKKSQTVWLISESKKEDNGGLSIARFNPNSGLFDLGEISLPSEFGTEAGGVREHFGNLLIPIGRTLNDLNYLLFDPINNKILGRYTYDDIEAQEQSQEKSNWPALFTHNFEEKLNGSTYLGVAIFSFRGFEKAETLEESQKRRIMIAIPGASGGEISSDEKFISFISSGVLVAREIVFLDKAKGEEFQVGLEKSQLTKQAKQLGVGLTMYASDNDDFLPLSANWQDAVHPYTKDLSVLNNAELLIPEKSQAQFEAPNMTPMARVEGKFGYVIIYADTSVRWFPKPRPNAKPD